jgi:hypothetical protein
MPQEFLTDRAFPVLPAIHIIAMLVLIVLVLELSLMLV